MLSDYFHEGCDGFLLPLQVFKCWHEITGSIWDGCTRFTWSSWEIATYFQRLALYSLSASQLHFRWVVFSWPTSWTKVTFICCCCRLFFSVTEVHCLNDTQKYLRKIVHEIGLELRSTAMCKGVRRTRDGPFTLKDALIHRQWTASDVMQAVSQYHSSKKRKKPPRTQENHTSTFRRQEENSETVSGSLKQWNYENEICNEPPRVRWGTLHQLHLIVAQEILPFHIFA